MSAHVAPEQVCYVHCNFCNTILVVSVPGGNSLGIVTVRCGHCANLLSVHLGALLQTLPQDVQVQTSVRSLYLNSCFAEFLKYYLGMIFACDKYICAPTLGAVSLHICVHQCTYDTRTKRTMDGVINLQNHNLGAQDLNMDCGSSSQCHRISMRSSMENVQQQTLSIRPPEKRQRVPSAYNRFIKEEIRRLKATNPDISHREAFSAAAKNWAHFPHIQFGLSVDGNKQQ